jgi:hypothetical protein
MVTRTMYASKRKLGVEPASSTRRDNMKAATANTSVKRTGPRTLMCLYILSLRYMLKWHDSKKTVLFPLNQRALY